MDEPRIITLMNYYKKLNIQLIIVVPTNHSKDIMPYVDTVVSLKKENNYIYETYLYNRQV
jgi:energy-coupling factor transporter ATP-binding protein EcfA2